MERVVEEVEGEDAEGAALGVREAGDVVQRGGGEEDRRIAQGPAPPPIVTLPRAPQGQGRRAAPQSSSSAPRALLTSAIR